MQRSLPARHFGFTAVCLASFLMLAACGGSGGDVSTGTPPQGPAASTLTGAVAVGAPIANGKLRVLDAHGDVVVEGLDIAADGRYPEVTLSGPAPYRIEACGHAGPNYLCVYSVASAAGTANVTPLTSATVLLASGQSPELLMTGSAPALSSASVAAAQDQLRASLASVLASAGVSATLDFVSAPLEAGSRAGYDGVLDAVGVSIGHDDQAFVQITPRLGEGNLYLVQGSTAGTVTATASAASLQLSGLETLFANMSSAVASASACSDATTGMQASMAATARISMGDAAQPAQGAAQVAAGLCSFFAGGEDGSSPMWGARLLSPTLGRCDSSGAAPVCGVSFVLQQGDDVQPVGHGMGVTQESGTWKFLGDLRPIGLQASAKAQRTRRIDTSEPVFDYDRALAFEVPALSGLACAKVSQRNGEGAGVTLGFYKRHLAAEQQQRLSLWTTDGLGNGASTDALVGQTRSADDTWIALPQGDAGDAVARNFYRGGRTVTVALYQDRDCSLPFTMDGKSSFDVEVEGVPPVWSAMQGLPWPELDADSQAALRSLALEAGASGSLHLAWGFPQGPLGLDGATVCASRADCGEGGAGRMGERSLRPSARDATISLLNRGPSVGADGQKTLALYGRSGEGMDLQSNYSSCPGVAAGAACH